MKLVTWNVNSIRTRGDQVLDWLEANDPDVLCMQETKVPDQEFPQDAFGDVGYDVSFYGDGGYNGVAIATKEEPERVQLGFPDDEEDQQRRIAALNIPHDDLGDIRIIDVYVPNGQELGSDKYVYKLEWLKKLRDFLEDDYDPDDAIVLCGDFNICPVDIDVGSPEITDLFRSKPERDAFKALLDFGLTDAFRSLHPKRQQYTWWDYRRNAFAKNEGLRIDHFLVSKPVLDRLVSVTVDTEARTHEQPSDHAPVILEIED